MAYIVPSVQILQRLVTPGGVLASTPDLNTVIVGPLFNVVRADPTDPTNAVRSLAKSSFNWATFWAGSTPTVALPSRVAGQRFVDYKTSLDAVFASTWVKVNTFKVDFTVFEDIADPAARVTLTYLTGGGDAPNFAFTSLSPDGNYALAIGDKIRYTIEIDPGSGTQNVTYESTVKSFDLTAGTITINNAVNKDVTSVVGNETVVVTVLRNYDVLEVPVKTESSDSASTNYVVTADADTNGTVVFKATFSAFPNATTTPAFYTVDDVSAFYLGYKALRRDNYNTVLTIDSPANLAATLGEDTDENPLALGVRAAMANTTGIVKALAIDEEDASGWLNALDVLESDDSVYCLVPLTQDQSILASFKQHVLQMSTPEMGSWRVTAVNTKIPTEIYIGNGTKELPSTAYVQQLATPNRTYLIDPEADFLTAGVVATDIVTIPTFTPTGSMPNGTTASSYIGVWSVADVIDKNTLKITSTTNNPVYAGTGANQSQYAEIPFYTQRTLQRADRAVQVAKVSETFNSNRIWHIQPDSVSMEVNGVVTGGLPGYYLASAHGGMVTGFPVQQGFTNIGVAGINDLQNSNYYFTRSNLNTMAETGTCLYVQATQGGIPYCRHALTTDITVLEYREQLKVKNWDFLSYYFKDKLKAFIGSWNITPDTIDTIRTTIIAAAEYLVAQPLPKIGPPLLSYNIVTLEQNAVNKDRLTVVIQIEIVSPLNYMDVTLEI